MAVKELSDGGDDGVRLGQSATDKVGFFGKAPAAQRSGAAQAAAPAGGTGATAGAYDTANNRDALINLVNEMRLVLVTHGLMKGSA
jgi:hypothetical protein